MTDILDRHAAAARIMIAERAVDLIRQRA